MMKPYVIDRMVDPNTDDVVMKNEPEVTGEPISEETGSQMLDLLEGAVIDPAGPGKPYYIEGFKHRFCTFNIIINCLATNFKFFRYFLTPA